MKKNPNNSVHLEGVLEAIEMIRDDDAGALAWASVVTLHVRNGVYGGAPPSERYEKLHHNIRVCAPARDAAALRALVSSHRTLSDQHEVFACRVEGRMYSDGRESFVDCDAKNLARTDLVKTNDNNHVRFAGKIVSLTKGVSDYILRVRARGDEAGESFPFRVLAENKSVWDSVVGGKVKKGDEVSLSGPLLSGRFSDGRKSLMACTVAPHSISKLSVRKVQKEGPSL